MTSFILQVLQRTPLWVWPLFLALVWLGVLQSRPRELSRTRLFVLPAVMIGLSLLSVGSTFGGAPVSLAAWGGGIALAVLVYRLTGRPAGVVYSPASRTYSVPGSWLPLTLMMAIFFSRYAISVTLAIQPLLREAAAFAGGVSLLSGLASGIFFARARRILRADR
jgi:hypothetical protein